MLPMANRPRHPKNQDRNFDDLADHFNKKIYGSLKGQIRLAVLERDFERHLPECATGLCALDVGGGGGHIAKRLAKRGYRLHLVDISSAMLAQARKFLNDEIQQGTVTLENASLQEMSTRTGTYNLVCCHAVLEWLHDPISAIDQLLSMVVPGGMLSLLVYNRDALTFRNLLRGNLRAAAKENQSGELGSLTPQNPQAIEPLLRLLNQKSVVIEARSGVRVFTDFMDRQLLQQLEPKQLMERELMMSEKESFWRLGRYIHLMIKC